MPLPEKNNQIITLDQASKYTSSYRAQAKADAIKGGLFWKDYVQKLLDQPGCIAMRYYHAQDDKGNPIIVLVGVNGDGHDITDGVLLEFGVLCPPWCWDTSPLNS